MNADYFDRLEAELRAAAPRAAHLRPGSQPSRRRTHRWRHSVSTVLALGMSAGVVAAVAAVFLSLHGSTRQGGASGEALFSRDEITLSYLRPGVGVIGLSRSLATVNWKQSSEPRLELTTDFVHWRDVTPRALVRGCRTRCPTLFESAYFLNASTGWVTAFNLLNDQDDLYGTTDGGASWRLELRTDHTLNAGATGVVRFLNPRQGWVAMLEPTGPGATYWRTDNGGATWTKVKPEPVGGAAPAWPFQFITSRIGYAADDSFTGAFPGSRLTKTTDGGRVWKTQSVHLPSWFRYRYANVSTWPVYELPTFTNSNHGVLPVLLPDPSGHATLAFYITSDRGAHWNLASTLKMSGADSAPQGDLLGAGPLVSIAGLKTWWVADRPPSPAAASYRIRITTNGGRTWTSYPSDLPPNSGRLQAVSSTQAWATTVTRQAKGGSEPEQTTDSGIHWSRVMP